MVYSAGSRDKQGAERAAWVPAMSHVLNQDAGYEDWSSWQKFSNLHTYDM